VREQLPGCDIPRKGIKRGAKKGDRSAMAEEERGNWRPEGYPTHLPVNK